MNDPEDEFWKLVNQYSKQSDNELRANLAEQIKQLMANLMKRGHLDKKNLNLINHMAAILRAMTDKNR